VGIFVFGKPDSNRQKMRQTAQRMIFRSELINGIVLGSIYGLIAIGYTMVYGIVGMIQFLPPMATFFMIGALSRDFIPDPGPIGLTRDSPDPG